MISSAWVHEENKILVQVSKELAQAEYQLREQRQFEENKADVSRGKGADYADMMLEKYSDAIRALKYAVEEREEDKIVAKYRNKTRDKARSALKPRQEEKQVPKQVAAQNKLSR